MGNLDELLESIKAEAKRESALTLYKGTRQDDLVDEEVDERILRLLGLEDTFDIDYATYISLLREKMAAARMTGSQMVTEEAELLTNEFKRVKRKVGRFKLKKKKISVDSSESSFLPALKSKKIQVDSEIPDSKSLKPQEESGGGDKSAIDAVSKELSRSSNILQRIGQVLSQQLSLQKGAIREDKKESKDLNKEEREKELEKKKSLTKDRKKAFKEFKAPAMGFFDTIKNYFKNILIGSVLVSIVNWFKDPDNQKKIQDFTNFVQNNIPLILGGLAAIALLPLASALLSFTTALLVGIPKLFKVLTLLATPLGIKLLLIALGVGGVIAIADSIANRMAGGSGFRAAQLKNAETFRELERDAKIREDGTVLTKSVGAGGGFVAAREQIALPDGTTMMQPVTVDGNGTFMPAIDDPKLGGERLKRYGLTQDDVDRYRAARQRKNELRTKRNEMDAEISAARDRIYTGSRGGLFGMGDKTAANDKEEQDFIAAEAEIRSRYNDPLLKEFGNPSIVENTGARLQSLRDKADEQIENLISPLQKKQPVPEAPDPSKNTSFINLGGGQSSEVATSAATPKQQDIALFSSVDPNHINAVNTSKMYSLTS